MTAAITAPTPVDAPDPGDGTATDGPPDEPTVALTLGEVAGLGGVTAVASVAVVSLALAQVGRHNGWLAAGLGVALAVALLAIARALGPLPAVSVDKVEIGLLVAAAVAGAVFFLPGFPYAAGDKDPGIYVAHGFAIAHTGDVAIEDVARERGLPAQHLPGVWPASHRAGDLDVTSQFYHLPSALFATADDIAGPRALFNVTPALAILSVLVFLLAARRASNTWAAAIMAALLITSMLQVWQAKMPSNEIPAQLFLGGALLAGILALERRWAGGAFVAGLLLSVGFLTRPDGFLYVLLALAFTAVGIAIGRFDRRAVALVAGLAVGMPYAAWNAYEARSDYSNANSVPGPLRLTLVCAAILGLGWLARALSVVWARRRAERATDSSAEGLDLVGLVHRFQLPIGLAVTLVSAAVLTLFWYRGRLFGPGTTLSPFHEGRIPSYDERNLWWLVMFTTRPGLVFMWLGIAVLFLSKAPRSRPALFLLALPGVLLPLYLYDARISMRLMWWGRRFIPAVLPAMALLTALTLAWALRHRFPLLKIAGAAATVWLVVALAGMSLPLRHHREMGGSWDIAYGISQVAGDEQGVFLFTESTDIVDPMRNSPVIVWWVFDEIAAKLPTDYDFRTIEEYQEAFPDQPVYLVLHDEPIPTGLPADRFVEVEELAQPIVMWEESIIERPDEAFSYPRGLTIWQLVDA